MKKMKCVHPRNVVKFMKAFAKQVCETGNIMYYNGDELLNPEADFWDWEFGEGIYLPCDVTMKKSDRFSYFIRDDDADSDVVITYNFDELFSKGSKEFRQDFTRRCPAGRGFSDITITLLHELGHAATNFDEDLLKFDRFTALETLRNSWNATHEKNERGINFEYFKLPDETAATNWAIKWLQDADHRRLAKAFEKKFFSCFATI